MIGPIDITRARGAHVDECDEGHRQNENRENYFTEELHADRVAKSVNGANPEAHCHHGLVIVIAPRTRLVYVVGSAE